MSFVVARVNLETDYYLTEDQQFIEEAEDNDIDSLSVLFQDSCRVEETKPKKVISIDRYFDLVQVGYFNGDFYIKIRNMYGSCMIAKVINGLLKGIEGKKQIFVLGYEGVNDNEIDIFLTI